MKACGDKPKQWPDHVTHAFFADQVTIRRQTGFSPYYLLYGTDLLLYGNKLWRHLESYHMYLGKTNAYEG